MNKIGILWFFILVTTQSLFAEQKTKSIDDYIKHREELKQQQAKNALVPKPAEGKLAGPVVLETPEAPRFLSANSPSGLADEDTVTIDLIEMGSGNATDVRKDPSFDVRFSLGAGVSGELVEIKKVELGSVPSGGAKKLSHQLRLTGKEINEALLKMPIPKGGSPSSRLNVQLGQTKDGIWDTVGGAEINLPTDYAMEQGWSAPLLPGSRDVEFRPFGESTTSMKIKATLVAPRNPKKKDGPVVSVSNDAWIKADKERNAAFQNLGAANTMSGLRDDEVIVVQLCSLESGNCDGYIRDPKFKVKIEAGRFGADHLFVSKKEEITDVDIGRVAKGQKTDLKGQEIRISGKEINNALRDAGTPHLENNELEIRALRFALYHAGMTSDDLLTKTWVMLPTPEIIKYIKKIGSVPPTWATGFLDNRTIVTTFNESHEVYDDRPSVFGRAPSDARLRFQIRIETPKKDEQKSEPKKVGMVTPDDAKDLIGKFQIMGEQYGFESGSSAPINLLSSVQLGATDIRELENFYENLRR